MLRTQVGAIAFVISTILATCDGAKGAPTPTGRYDLTSAFAYSDLCYHQETGDVIGMRVFVRAPRKRPRVVVQFAEGVLMEPVAARALISGRKIAFTVIEGDLPMSFSGEFHGRLLILRSNAPESHTERLHLRTDIAGFPDCR